VGDLGQLAIDFGGMVSSLDGLRSEWFGLIRGLPTRELY